MQHRGKMNQGRKISLVRERSNLELTSLLCCIIHKTLLFIMTLLKSKDHNLMLMYQWTWTKFKPSKAELLWLKKMNHLNKFQTVISNMLSLLKQSHMELDKMRFNSDSPTLMTDSMETSLQLLVLTLTSGLENISLKPMRTSWYQTSPTLPWETHLWISLKASLLILQKWI